MWRDLLTVQGSLKIGRCKCGKSCRVKSGKKPICPDCIRAFKQQQSEESRKLGGDKPHIKKVRYLKGRPKPPGPFEADTYEQIVELAKTNGHCACCGEIKESPDRKRCDRCIAIAKNED